MTQADSRQELILSKLAALPVSPDCVSRQRLFARLDAGVARRLTLVMAPAGYGKTTLLSSWYAARSTSPRHGPAVALAWLSLESAENDPAHFWAYIVAALQTAHGSGSDHPLMTLEIAPLASSETFLTALLNGFSLAGRRLPSAEPTETILILDDYHAITNQAIHHDLAFLLNHLPPSLHLVIGSRSAPPLPLTRLRAADQLTELDTDDLRFTDEELARFLRGAAPLAFSADQVARLRERADGWIMPLHLATLAWRGRTDSEAFLASLRGDQQAIFTYLVEEVFERQTAETQRFLLATSLLARCGAALCDAVLGRADSQRVLERLARERLLLVPLDETRQWYRYHALFAEFLRERLRQTSPDEMAGWHSRAADWYLEQDPTGADSVALALPHLLAARDWERAADLIEVNAERMLWRSGEAATLLRWIGELPRANIAGRPRIALAQAWALTFGGELEAAEAALQLVEDMERDPRLEVALRTRALAGETLAIHARLAAFADAARAGALSRRALRLLPSGADGLRADLLLNLGYAQLRGANYAAAGRAFAGARRMGMRAGNMRAVMLASRYLAGSAVARGLLNDAATVYRQALRLVSGDQPIPLAAGAIHIGNALLLYERNALEAALSQAEQGLALGQRSGEIKTLLPGYLALAQISQGRGDLAGAGRALDEAERLSDLGLFPWTNEEVAAARARLHLALGEVALAARALSRNGWQLVVEQPRDFATCPLSIQLAWARVLRARRRPLAAAALLQRILVQLRSEQPQTDALPVIVSLALAHAASGAETQALALLTSALEPALEQGYTRIFVDEGAPVAALLRLLMARDPDAAPGVDALLAEFPAPALEEARPDGAGFLPEAGPLSAREVEVMRLLADGLSNQQIAERLIVAVSTVRTHTKHIYRKLGVRGRVRAVARATALRVL